MKAANGDDNEMKIDGDGEKNAASVSGHTLSEWNAPFNYQPPGDRYVFARKLCKTIYGEVWLAYIRGTEPKKLVAVKLSRLSLLQNQKRILENPEDENRVMRILSTQDCPYVIKLLATHRDNNYHYSVLEFCPNGEFFNIIAEKGALGGEQCRNVFVQLCKGVEYIHQRGFMHLDLSLENMLLGANNECKVCDFGMARRAVNNGNIPSDPKSKPGKLGYQSPEIFAGKAFNGFLADTYSMGVMLFIMATGTPPYKIPNPELDPRFKMIYEGAGVTELLRRWNFINMLDPGLVDLLEHLLCPEAKRYSIQQIKKHKWIQMQK